MNNIRNFCIIAHIDHGKSTLADRILELTNSLTQREMRDQYLDELEIERKRGITIKLNAVRLNYVLNNQHYELHLIDTPGHVDFNYEVSRSLAACEGALLVVDACAGIQSQTLSNLYLAIEQDLTIIPVINKIDLPNANIEKTQNQLMNLLSVERNEIVLISSKNGTNVPFLIETLIKKIPSPVSKYDTLRALIFDSYYDTYRGTVLSIRVFDGEIKINDRIKLFNLDKNFIVENVYYRNPKEMKCSKLSEGEVGLITIKNRTPDLNLLGDTVMLESNPSTHPIEGYKDITPFVFSSLYPTENKDFKLLRDGIAKIHVTDPGFSFVSENSQALGYGFRCGFLGTLHMEVVKDRLEKEYKLNLIASFPQVAYKVNLTNHKSLIIDNASKFPDRTQLESVEEPLIDAKIFTPSEYVGKIMELCHSSRGEFVANEVIDGNTVSLNYKIPLGEIIYTFYDTLKSITKGYASMEYVPLGYKKADLVKLDILLNGTIVDALSLIIHRSKANFAGREIALKIKEEIPRQNFEIPIQAMIGGKIVARETISAVRKNVTAKLYGGDVTRKKKLLEKQKKGKKRMKQMGKVSIPHDALRNIFIVKK